MSFRRTNEPLHTTAHTTKAQGGVVMTKKVYISADYSATDGDRIVVDTLNAWGEDALHKVDFVDMSKVASGSVAKDSDCRICDLKSEFNRQINASSVVIIVVGNKTSSRTAGSACRRSGNVQNACSCTPYKQNTNGVKPCKVSITSTPGPNDDVGYINSYSYLRHEFEQANKKKKTIIVIYNSLRCESDWLPSYLSDYENEALPFWILNSQGKKVGNYSFIKEVLGFA